jgi:valyl-tRNA synthetase
VTVSAAAAGPTACEACGRPAAELTQDPDIFDTWYSSGLWPFSTLGWPDDTPDLRRYYPTTVMETGYDIIFFWVARMMMLGIHFTGQAPFRTVYLHGLVKDPYGQRMSKTKGNVVDPLEVISESGADALRFALVNGTSPGNDQKLSAERLENARNFANKTWNAARFVLGARPPTIAADAPRVAPDPGRLGPADRWLRSRIAATVEAVDAAMDGFALGEATRLLYEATWSEYCDWGLELAKVRLADERLAAEEREATWWTLVEGLDALLRLLHPFMPFLTEAIWAALPRASDDPDLLIVADWPDRSAWTAARDPEAEAAVDRLRALVTEVRNARSTARIAPGASRPGDVLVPAELATTFDAVAPAIERLARLRPLVRHADRTSFSAAERPGSLAVIAGDLEARIGADPGDLDAGAAERARLGRELAEAERFLEAARTRLADEAFTTKAPPAIVAGARAREAELADQVARLRARLSG